LLVVAFRKLRVAGRTDGESFNVAAHGRGLRCLDFGLYTGKQRAAKGNRRNSRANESGDPKPVAISPAADQPVVSRSAHRRQWPRVVG
jgi:hypothetical protein